MERLRGLAAVPRTILSLLKAGQLSRASIHVMFAGALAQAFVAAWTVGVAPLLLLLLSGIESLTGRNLSGETSDTLLMVAWLPAFIVAPIVPLGGILGAITGFLGLFRSDGSRLLGAVGLILSIGLLTISAIVAVVAWGL